MNDNLILLKAYCRLLKENKFYSRCKFFHSLNKIMSRKFFLPTCWVVDLPYECVNTRKNRIRSTYQWNEIILPTLLKKYLNEHKFKYGKKNLNKSIKEFKLGQYIEELESINGKKIEDFLKFIYYKRK